MNKKWIRILALCLAAMLLAGCSVQIHVNEDLPSAEELLANRSLIADPVPYDADGQYTVIFRSAEGGFAQMDLSRAYVAYEPFTLQDQIDDIVGEDADELPPLPADGQAALDEALDADTLVKIAIVTIRTLDDSTLQVSFTDPDPAPQGREYFFIIPNAGRSGSVIPG